MILRRPQTPTRTTVAAGVGLATLAAGLTLAGTWLNLEFARGRGPVRVLSPQVVVDVSLAAVGLVLLLWIVASATGGDGRDGNQT